MVEYKLHYFDLYARGEPIRILLNYAKVKFQDIRIKRQDWPQLKAQYPNGQLPALELQNGEKLFQSMSILRFLGKVHGFYPEDPAVAYEVDRLLDYYVDVFDLIGKPAFVPAEQFEEAFKIAAQKLTDTLTILEPLCAKGSWLVGDKITIADFCLAGFYTNGFINPKIYTKDRWDQILVKFPNYRAYGQRFYNANQEYLSARPQSSF